MSTFHLPYKVDVDVEVDTETGEVTRVRVIDESISWDDDGTIYTADWLPIAVTDPSDNDLLAKAQQISEEAEWPEWSHS